MDGETKNQETVAALAPPEISAPATLTDPTLTANLLANYAALRNDVQQARELAADFQSQLAGKSNDLADLKRIFGETKSHLSRLEASIAGLREERHRLAGEAMRAVALDRKLAERDTQISQLKNEIATLQERLASATASGTGDAMRDRTKQEAPSGWRSWFRRDT